MQLHYLEIVTPEVDATCTTYAQLHGVTFTDPEPGLGNARTAKLDNGGMIGVRIGGTSRDSSWFPGDRGTSGGSFVPRWSASVSHPSSEHTRTNPTCRPWPPAPAYASLRLVLITRRTAAHPASAAAARGAPARGEGPGAAALVRWTLG
jgi:hypothetical protein